MSTAHKIIFSIVILTLACIAVAVGWARYTNYQRLEKLCDVPGKKEFGKEPENPDAEYSIVARDGKFSADYFHIYHFAHSVLRVFAEDADYRFWIKDSGIDAVLKKGTTTEIQLGSLGMGKHVFICGPGCEGTVFVDRDLDDYCEE